MKKLLSPKKIILFLIILVIVGIAIYGVIKVSQSTQVKKIERLAKAISGGDILLNNIKAAENELKDDSTDNDFNAYGKIAFSYEALGEYNGAEKFYLKALKIRPTDNLTLWNVANLYVKEKKFQDAEKTFSKLLELDPYLTRAYIARADLYRYLIKDEGKMVESLKSGLKHNPGSADILAYLAVYYKDKGEKVTAVEYYEKLLKFAPQNEAAKQELEELRRQP